jgi:hypothetical protein
MGHKRRPKEGAKYQATKDLRRVEVAKLIRADLKAFFGPRSAWKASVTCDGERGTGKGIDVGLTPPAGFLILNPDRVADELRNPHGNQRGYPRFSPAAQWVLDQVLDLVNAYNFDESDIGTDYFNVRFYEDVKIDGRAEVRELHCLELILGRAVMECMMLHDLVAANRLDDARALALKVPNLARKGFGLGADVKDSAEVMAPILVSVIAARIAALPAPTVHTPDDPARPVLSPSACRPLAPFPS